MRMRLFLAGAVLATTFASSTAMAAPALRAGGGVDWSRLLLEVDEVARRGADVLDSPRCSSAGCQTDTNATASAPEREVRYDTADKATNWFGGAPRVSLVARDWRSSFRVTGERLSLVDTLRLTSSTRMVLARVRMTDARVTPFVQFGLGQWRTDPFILPLTPRYEEIAGQAAAGVEVRVLGTWVVGLEQTVTVLHREHGDRSLPSPRMWSSTIASRVEF
jgi:hypothetical protein